MSLFARLLKLHTGSVPLEDFFTELVAYLFEMNKEILYDWLIEIGLSDVNNYSDVYISTQREFDPLDGDNRGNRPDVVIELVGDNGCDIIFIESKVASIAMPDQLQRYAKVLDRMANFRHKFLFFITRDFEPKDRAVILKDIPTSTVQFKQLRWHQFYRFLRSRQDIMLVQEIISFMERHNMAHNNQFSSVDVITLANFTKSLKLMEETMWGRVSTEFKSVLGAVRNRASALTQVQYHGRYLMTMNMSGWWCGLGFILKTEDLTGYPRVRLILEVEPKSPHRAEIIAAMKDIGKKDGWESRYLGDSNAWASVVREKSLQDFLSKGDHVISIEEFFLQALIELRDIRSEYPNLPWKTVTTVGIAPDGSTSDGD
jgi:hypothetical protein